MSRFLLKAAAAVLAIVAIVGLAGYAYLRQSLPLVDGAISLAGIAGPVDIIRDADAIPHIFATTKLDALYGLGYAHAHDRLWQMEFQRRIGHGRLSEIFGEVTLSQDRFLRTVGFGRAARAAWDRLPADARRQVDGYVAGINAFVAAHHGSALPPEFSLLRFEPEPWTGPDVIAWVKMMAWDLSANYSLELMRQDMASRVGRDRMAELLPPYPADGLSILTERDLERTEVSCCEAQTRRSAAPGGGPRRSEKPLGPATRRKNWGSAPDSALSVFLSGLSSGEPRVRALLLGGATTEALGSNNWVVDGTLTATGRPLLANDPHLGTHVPSLWYLAHMTAGDFDVIGATLPGAPAVAIGRNRFIAWGESNVAADVEDLYLEHLDQGGKSAEFRGVQEPLRIVTETIGVKGGAPVTIDVRLSRHGPLVSDAINANNAYRAEAKKGPKPAPLEPLAFRWTALDDDDRTIVAFLGLNEARNWSEFTAALREFVAPAQNFVYADVNGHIGYYAPGRIPIRADGDGSLPAEGWTGHAEWTGWIPFDELPHTYDPPEHFIVTANNRPMPSRYPHLIALEYPEPYRAQRITDLIGRRAKLTVDDFQAIQADTLSLHAQALLPSLLRHVRPQGAAHEQAVELLHQWNFDARGDSAASAIFQAWFLRLAPTLAGDELGPLVSENYEGRFSYITRFVVNTLTRADSQWCDDVRTAGRETCEDAVTAALQDGVARLTRQLGEDMPRWRWDAVHRAVFPHQGLDAVGLLRPLLSRSVPNGGDWSTVNVGPVAADHPFEQRSVPGYRQIVDLSPANDSRFLDAVGQSGHFLSRHYDDFLQDWREVRHRRMRMERADVERGAIGHLRLMPREAKSE